MTVLCTTSSFGIDELHPRIDLVKNPYRCRLSEDEVAGQIEKYRPVGIIAGVEPLTEKVLWKAASLRVISRCGSGLDSVDLNCASQLGIEVFNTPEAPVPAVAEMAVALILALLRHLHTAGSAIRSGDWPRISGGLVHGKTVGIVGCGRIGTYVSKLLRSFGCRIVGYDPCVKEHPECIMVSFDELLHTSEIITVHAPCTEENRHLIDDACLGKMKKTAVLINTGRGALIDESALADALDSGAIAGAALDVFEAEPYNGRLRDYTEKTLLTPYLSSSAGEIRTLMEREAADNLLKGLEEIGILQLLETS